MLATDDLPPEDARPVIRVLATPADTNPTGDIFGGWLMSQVDIAGSIVAGGHSNGRVVTVAVNNFVFLKPVFVGDIISIYSHLIKIGNTSLQVACDVFAEEFAGIEACRKVATAVITYVSIDENRRPKPVTRKID